MPLDNRARFIPACAGQTKTTPDDLMAIWVHPRSCGVNILFATPGV